MGKWRISPLMLAAAALAAGAVAGFWLATGADAPAGSSGTPGSWISLLAGAVCLGIARRRSGNPGASRSFVALAAAACALCGSSLGFHAGARALSSCAAELRAGDAVVATGRLLSPILVEAGPRGLSGEVRRPASRVRNSLSRPVLVHRGRRCRLARLTIRTDRGAEALGAGRVVAVSGSWRVIGEKSAGIRSPERYGYVSGVLLKAESSRAVGGSLGVGRPLLSLRGHAAERLDRLLPDDVAPMARALLLADRAELAPEVSNRFVDAGLAHLLAISGMHVGLLAGGLLGVLGLRWRGQVRWVAAALFTVGYVVFIGAPPSAVRAALVFAGYAVSRIRGAPARLGDLAGLAAGIAIVADPLVLVSPGFQLSYAGFGGVWAGQRAGRRIAAGRGRRSVVRLAAPPLCASFGAFLATAPIAAAHFQRVVPASVLSNLVGAPLLGLSLAALVGSLVLPGPLAELAAGSATVVLRALLETAELFRGLPLQLSVSPPAIAGWLALGLVAWGVALGASGTRPLRLAAQFGLAACVWLASPAWLELRGRHATLVCSIDVGQGDATAVRTRMGRWILIDAGPGPGFASSTARSPSRPDLFRDRFEPTYGDAGRRTLVPFLRSRGARGVELFVLTHPHLDHLGGAATLFARFRVRRVLDAGVAHPSRAYLAFLDAVEAEGARWLPARSGARLRLDEVSLLVLWPPAELERTEDMNDASVAVRVAVDGFTYLNTGDASTLAEDGMLRLWPADSLRVDLLKLGHHGSRTSSSARWLETTRPEAVVVSAGTDNRFGHPHPITLARVEAAGIERVWRTGWDGTVCVEVLEDGRWSRSRADRPHDRPHLDGAGNVDLP